MKLAKHCLFFVILLTFSCVEADLHEPYKVVDMPKEVNISNRNSLTTCECADCFTGLGNLDVTIDLFKDYEGDDYTEAFIKASKFIRDACGSTQVVRLFIPAGDYEVGRQLEYGVTEVIGSETFTNLDVEKLGYDLIDLEGCSNVKILGQPGTNIIYKSGLFFGRFDGSAPTNAADIGAFIKLKNTTCIYINNINVDGNNSNLVLGGEYPDTSDGYQLAHDGVVVESGERIKITNSSFSYFGRDGIILTREITSGTTVGSPDPSCIEMDQVNSEYNGRQGMTWAAGNCLNIKNSSFSHTGKGGVFSGPGAGLDIEPIFGEGQCERGEFYNCDFNDNIQFGMISDGHGDHTTNITFKSCQFWANENTCAGSKCSPFTVWPYLMKNTQFHDCKFFGPMVHIAGTSVDDQILFKDCEMYDEYLGNETVPGYLYLINLNQTARDFVFYKCHIETKYKQFMYAGHAYDKFGDYTYRRYMIKNDFAFKSSSLKESLGYGASTGPCPFIGLMHSSVLYSNRFTDLEPSYDDSLLFYEKVQFHAWTEAETFLGFDHPTTLTDGNNTFSTIPVGPEPSSYTKVTRSPVNHCGTISDDQF